MFAWAPVVRAEDRANILVYSTSSELIACHYTEHNPFSVEFSAKDSGQLRAAELLSSAKLQSCFSSQPNTCHRDTFRLKILFVFFFFSGPAECPLHNLQCAATFQATSTPAFKNPGTSPVSLAQPRRANLVAGLRRRVCHHLGCNQRHHHYLQIRFRKFDATSLPLDPFFLRARYPLAGYRYPFTCLGTEVAPSLPFVGNGDRSSAGTGR